MELGEDIDESPARRAQRADSGAVLTGAAGVRATSLVPFYRPDPGRRTMLIVVPRRRLTAAERENPYPRHVKVDRDDGALLEIVPSGF